MCIAYVAIRNMDSRENSKESIEVLFPLALLKEDPRVLDPDNLETTSEYYLLENLAVGLLRDDLNNPSGYSGAIAESWKRTSDNEWRFQIKRNLKYSDGLDVKLDEIIEALQNRSKSNARHLKILPTVSEITSIPETNEITLKFKKQIGETLLAELSLADASIITKKTIESGWRKTLAPYFITEHEYGKKLILEKNKFFGWISRKSPSRVVLRFSNEETERLSWFENKEIDLFDASAFTFKARNEKITSIGYGEIFSPPNIIHFLVPNSKNSIYIAHPELVETLVEEAKKVLVLKHKNFSFYDQLIPPGYSGAIQTTRQPSPKFNDVHISGKIALYEDFQEWPEVADSIREAGKKLGWQIQVVYFNRFKPFDQTNDILARTYVFKGNQKDASGSWSFLFHPTHGPLSHFRKNLGHSLDGDTEIEDLKKIHREVLNKHWATPFLIEAPMIYFSKRVSLKTWNPFDLRLRFYEIEME
jgi:hypothetical protein